MRPQGSPEKRVPVRSVIAVVVLAALFRQAPAWAAEWRVVPIRLELGSEAKTGSVRVINEKPEKLTLQLKLMEWAQDAEGKDRYTPSEDILYFPRILVFSRDEERVVRAGIKVPSVKTEKTYRLFMEEVPEQRTGDGTQVAIALRVGVPVFVKPLREEIRGEIGQIALVQGAASAAVTNAGNTHLLIRSVVFRGRNAGKEEIFSREVAGWYLLAGASRRYSAEIPNDVCAGVAELEIEVKSDRLSVSGKLNVAPAMCGR